jgi:hypothetical protein
MSERIAHHDPSPGAKLGCWRWANGFFFRPKWAGGSQCRIHLSCSLAAPQCSVLTNDRSIPLVGSLLILGVISRTLRRLSIGAEPKWTSSIDQRRSPLRCGLIPTSSNGSKPTATVPDQSELLLRPTVNHLTEETSAASGKRRSRRTGKGQ